MFVKLFRLLFLLTVILLSNVANASYPIYIALTHPRATGTAFEQIFRARKDMKVLHVPFFNAYLVKKYPPGHPFLKNFTNVNLTFEDVKKHLFELAEESPVFIKEMGYVFTQVLQQDPEFIKNPQIKLMIFVRDPAKSVISFYRKMPNLDESILGQRQLWALFEQIQLSLHQDPIVIDSDEFLKNPLYALNQLGKDWGLEFNADHLKWNQGFAEDWHLKHFYEEVGNSTELGQYRGDVPRLPDGIPEYAEIQDQATRERLQNLFQSQNIYYQKLRAKSLPAENTDGLK